MISVFTSSFNNAEFLKQSIESVLSQTYTNFEYLLFDDGSTDNTWTIIEEYSKKDNRIIPIKLDKQKNLACVLNKSLLQAKGDVWSWCPSDDIWYPTLLERKLLYHSNFPDSVLYSDFIAINDNGERIGQVFCPNCTPQEYKELVWKTSTLIGFTGIIIPMNIFKTVGNFPEKLNFSEDFYWMIKATIHNIPFRYVPEVLHFKRIHPNSLTSKNLPKILENIPVIRQELLEYKKILENKK